MGNEAHPLAIDQDHGVNADRILAIFESSGHFPENAD
jgi:hypothetical protein